MQDIEVEWQYNPKQAYEMMVKVTKIDISTHHLHTQLFYGYILIANQLRTIIMYFNENLSSMLTEAIVRALLATSGAVVLHRNE